MAKIWVAHTIEIDNLVESESPPSAEGRFRFSLAFWANGLRLVDEAGTTLGEMRRQARGECNIGGLERWGWITVGDPPHRQGARRVGFGTSRGLRADTVLRPTRAGMDARRIWPAAVAEVENRWQHRFGADVIESIRRELAGVGTAMPWAPPQVSPADGFRTAVLEGGAETDPTEPPFVIRLAQTLTEFTLRAEAGARISLPLGENLLDPLEEKPRAVKDLPAVTGVSKEAVSMAVNFAVRRGLADLSGDRILALTSRGSGALADHRTRQPPGARQSLHEAIEEVLARPEALAAGLEPPPGGWRAKRPYLAQTRRLLTDPVASLPRHPMVLHRGGWPDGC